MIREKNKSCKRFYLVIFLCLLTFCFSSVAAGTETTKENNVSGEVSVAALSQYISKGMELSRHSVVIQPSVTVTYKGFGATIWSNWDSSPYLAGEDRWNEVEYTLFYGNEYRFLNYEIGYVYDEAFGYSPDTHEIYVQLGANVLLEPAIKITKEVGNDRYWYFLFSLGHSFPLIQEKLFFRLSASAGYLHTNDEGSYPKLDKYGDETGHAFKNFLDGKLKADLPYNLSENVTITPTLSYTFPLTSEAKHLIKYMSMTGKEYSFLYGGLIVTYSF